MPQPEESALTIFIGRKKREGNFPPMTRVVLDGKTINIEMVKAGLAEVYRGEPARGLDMSPYWKAEEQAKAIRKRHVVFGWQVRESEGVEE